MSRPPLRPAISRAALIAAAAVLVLTFAAQALTPAEEGGFALAAAPGAAALIAVLATLGVCAGAALLRVTLARREDHYVEDFDDGDQP